MDTLKNITVAHITSAHTCEDVRIFYREARLLSGRVREVILLAPDATESTKDGVRFVRYGNGMPRNRKERIDTAREAAASLEKLHPDLVHFHDPELLISVPDYAHRRGIPAIYDVHENYRSTLADNTGGLKGELASKLYSLYERIKMRKISGIVTVTRQIAEKYEPYGKPVVLLRNFPDIERILKLVPDGTRQVDKNKLLYSGSLDQRSLIPLALAVKRISLDYPDISVTLIGTFRDNSMREKIEEYWNINGVLKRLNILERLERNEFLSSLSEYSLGLVLFWPTKNVQVALPNKMFEYMAAALPVIVPDCPNQRSIVQEAECGIYCDTTNSEDIEQAIRRLLANPSEAREMGKRGREACRTKYNMQTDFRSLLGLYERVLQ